MTLQCYTLKKNTVPLVWLCSPIPTCFFYIGYLSVLLFHVRLFAVSHRELLRGGGAHCSQNTNRPGGE